MKRMITCIAAVLIAVVVAPGFAKSEILAMMNYESKPAESLKALKLTGPREREEGIALHFTRMGFLEKSRGIRQTPRSTGPGVRFIPAARVPITNHGPAPGSPARDVLAQ